MCVCLSVSVGHTWKMRGAYEFRYLQRPEVDPLGATVTDSYKLPHMSVKKPNTGPLPESQVILASKPSLWPPRYFFLSGSIRNQDLLLSRSTELNT